MVLVVGHRTVIRNMTDFRQSRSLVFDGCYEVYGRQCDIVEMGH